MTKDVSLVTRGRSARYRLVRPPRGVPRGRLHQPLEGLLAPPLPQVTLPKSQGTSHKSQVTRQGKKKKKVIFFFYCQIFVLENPGKWNLGSPGSTVVFPGCTLGVPGRRWRQRRRLVTREVRSVAEGSVARVRPMSSQGHMRLPFDCTYLIRLTTCPKKKEGKKKLESRKSHRKAHRPRSAFSEQATHHSCSASTTETKHHRRASCGSQAQTRAGQPLPVAPWVYLLLVLPLALVPCVVQLQVAPRQSVQQVHQELLRVLQHYHLAAKQSYTPIPCTPPSHPHPIPSKAQQGNVFTERLLTGGGK